MTTIRQPRSHKAHIDISSERCVSCKSRLGGAVKGFNFIDRNAKTAFMKKRRFPLDSKICISCVNSFKDYDPAESILANARELLSDELFAYLSMEDAALKLVKSEMGMTFLVKATNGHGRSALHEAVSKHESVALELMKTDLGRKLLATTKDETGWSALHEAVSRHAEAALEMAKTKAGIKLLAATKDEGERSALHVAVRHRMATIEIMKNHGWIKILEDTRDHAGKTALHNAAYWHEEVAVALINGLRSIKHLHKIAYSVGYGSSLSVLYACIGHEKAAMRVISTPGGTEVLALDGLDDNGFGKTALHEAVSKHKRVAMRLIRVEDERTLLAHTNRYRNGFYRKWSALYSALRHEEVRMELIKTKMGRKLLAHKPEGSLVDGIEIAISYDPKVMVSKLLRIRGGRKYIENTKYDNLLPPTRMQRLLAFAGGLIRVRT